MNGITDFLETIALKLRPMGVMAAVVAICSSIWLVVSGGLFSLGRPVLLGNMWIVGIAVLYTAYYPGEPFARRAEKRGRSAARKAPDWVEDVYGFFILLWFVGLILFTVGELWG